MLPFTTYNIPETSFHKTPSAGQWLWIITNKALSEDDQALLKKICGALKSENETQVFYLMADNGSHYSLASLINSETRLIISFGVPPGELGLWIDLPKPGIRLMDQVAFILTIPIQELHNHPLAKKQLWISMQTFLESNSSLG